MAIVFAELTQGTDTLTGANDSSVTASISPTANAQVFAALLVAQDTSEGTNNITASVAGCNLTWSAVTELRVAARRRLFIFRGTGASPSSGSLTFTIGRSDDALNLQEAIWSIDEATGVDSGTPIGTVYSNTTATTSPLTVTVSDSLDSGDFVYAAMGGAESAGYTAEAGFTVLTNISGGANARSLVVMYDDSDLTPSWTFTNTGAGGAGAIAFVVNTASSGVEMTPAQAATVFTGSTLSMGFTINMPDEE